MHVFSSVITFLARRPAAITVLFLYSMDQLFGTIAFECPCTLPKKLRKVFAIALLICPALMIIILDTPWSLLFSIIKAQFCCCREACGGALMAVIPPMGFALAWIFIFQESEQFSVCINTTSTINQTGCVEDYHSTESLIRISSVVLLYLMTSALGLRALIKVLTPFCNRCCKSLWEPCCKSLCEARCIRFWNNLCGLPCCSCCRSHCDSCCKSCCDSCCNSCCDCVTIHPDSVLLKRNLSFSTFYELEREHLLIEDEHFKSFPLERIDKLNIGQGQKVRLKNQRIPGPVRSLKARTNGTGDAMVTWIAPNNVKGQDIGYIIQYKEISDLKQRRNQQMRQQNKSTAKLSTLECNVRYSIQIWVIKTSDLSNSEKKYFCSIEICTTESTGQERIFIPDNSREPSSSNADVSRSSLPGGNVLSGEVWKFSKIVVTHDSVYLEWNLEEGAKNLEAGANNLVAGAKNLEEGAKNLEAGAKNLEAGAKNLEAGAKNLEAGAKNVEAGAQRTFIGYELQYKIVKNQNHKEIEQSETEMSAEFFSLQADVLYRFEIWAYNGNIQGESSSIEIVGDPEMRKKLLCNKCSEEHHLENTHLKVEFGSTSAGGNSQNNGAGIGSTSAGGSSQSGGAGIGSTSAGGSSQSGGVEFGSTSAGGNSQNDGVGFASTSAGGNSQSDVDQIQGNMNKPQRYDNRHSVQVLQLDIQNTHSNDQEMPGKHTAVLNDFDNANIQENETDIDAISSGKENPKTPLLPKKKKKNGCII